MKQRLPLGLIPYATLVLLLNLFVPACLADTPTKMTEEEVRATAIGANFMKLVTMIQTSTSRNELLNLQLYLKVDAKLQEDRLQARKLRVSDLYAKIMNADQEIEDVTFRKSMAANAQEAERCEQELMRAQKRRESLVLEQKEAYRSFARSRGACIVILITYNLFTKEAEKRLAVLGSMPHGGWSGTYIDDTAKTFPQDGTFLLSIDPDTGNISGQYSSKTEEFLVKGSWNRSSGACSGTANQRGVSTSFSGTLRSIGDGYSGDGTFTYMRKGGSFSGEWKTE